jgi:large subunit ribosomal protein L25
MLSVSVRSRTGKGAARQLRAAGQVPGILYGENEPARPIQIEAARFEALRRSGAHHRLLDVVLGDGPAPVKALVREVQVHPVSRAVVHVDLQRVSMEKRIRVQVPIVLLGKPEGVRTQGGILEHNLREVEVECLPSDIPERIEIDVSALHVGQAVHIRDLHRPGIQFLGHPDANVTTVSLPAAEKAHEEVAAAAAAATTEAAAGEEKPEEGEKAEKAEKPEKPERSDKGKPERGSPARGGSS